MNIKIISFFMLNNAFPVSKKSVLPKAFRPLFWSYRFDELDPKDDKRMVIVQLINYGTLRHWAWLVHEYGMEEIKRVIESIPATEIKPRTRALASLLFGVTDWNYAQRGAH